MPASLETIEAQLTTTRAEMADGFKGITARLDRVNGRLDEQADEIAKHCTDIAVHEERIKSTETAATEARGSWRTLGVQIAGAVILYFLFQVMPKLMAVVAKAAQ